MTTDSNLELTNFKFSSKEDYEKKIASLTLADVDDREYDDLMDEYVRFLQKDEE